MTTKPSPTAPVPHPDWFPITEGKTILVAPMTRYEHKATADNPAIPETTGDLACIRAGTEFEADDAKALAKRVLRGTKGLDTTTAAHSELMFAHFALQLRHNAGENTVNDVLKQLASGWHSPAQIHAHFHNLELHHCKPTSIVSTQLFRKELTAQLGNLGDVAEVIIDPIIQQWTTAIAKWNAPKRRSHTTASTRIPIFPKDKLIEASLRHKEVRKDRSTGLRSLASANLNDGFRTLPNIKKALQRLESKKLSFENLTPALDHFTDELRLISAMKKPDFRIAPMLLLGEPGIGKTFLAMQLNAALGVPCQKVSGGSAQASFFLTGGNTQWAYAAPGAIFNLLAYSQSATPVLIIDEIDKLAKDSQYPLMPVLLDLLEERTAKAFRDEYFEIEFDASRLIIILTANCMKCIPPPLLSRVETFHIERPSVEQRARIIQDEITQLIALTRRPIQLHQTALDQLANRTDLDLRITSRLIRSWFGKAVEANSESMKPILPNPSGRQPIGFMQ